MLHICLSSTRDWVCFNSTLFTNLPRKDAMKRKSPDIGHLSPPCPHLVSDLSPAPLLISRGIEVTLPFFPCCCRIAVAYGHSSSLQ